MEKNNINPYALILIILIALGAYFLFINTFSQQNPQATGSPASAINCASISCIRADGSVDLDKARTFIQSCANASSPRYQSECGALVSQNTESKCDIVWEKDSLTEGRCVTLSPSTKETKKHPNAFCNNPPPDYCKQGGATLNQQPPAFDQCSTNQNDKKDRCESRNFRLAGYTWNDASGVCSCQLGYIFGRGGSGRTTAEDVAKLIGPEGLKLRRQIFDERIGELSRRVNALGSSPKEMQEKLRILGEARGIIAQFLPSLTRAMQEYRDTLGQILGIPQ